MQACFEKDWRDHRLLHARLRLQQAGRQRIVEMTISSRGKEADFTYPELNFIYCHAHKTNEQLMGGIYGVPLALTWKMWGTSDANYATDAALGGNLAGEKGEQIIADILNTCCLVWPKVPDDS